MEKKLIWKKIISFISDRKSSPNTLLCTLRMHNYIIIIFSIPFTSSITSYTANKINFYPQLGLSTATVANQISGEREFIEIYSGLPYIWG